MPEPPERFLGQALAALLREQRISISHVMRWSGLSRNTIAYILTGKTRRPSAATLRKLAVAVAIDPATGELDRESMADAERTLAQAVVGDDDPTARGIESLTELGLYYQLRSRAKAAAWAETIARLAALSPGAVRALAPPTDA